MRLSDSALSELAGQVRLGEGARALAVILLTKELDNPDVDYVRKVRAILGIPDNPPPRPFPGSSATSGF